MISATIIADSINKYGNRITTMEVVMPRFILAEFNTHRVFSRNSASSRAIPFEKMVKSVQKNPFIPIAWQKEHKGMQGTEYLDNSDLKSNAAFNGHIAAWLTAKANAIRWAKALSRESVTKQLCNRLLEPFMWHKVIVTSTEWSNFFELRCPRYEVTSPVTNRTVFYKSRKDVLKAVHKYDSLDMSSYTELDWLALNKGQAEIHISTLAEAMFDAMKESVPNTLEEGEWHIPFGDKLFQNTPTYEVAGLLGCCVENIKESECDLLKVKIATARCARISYTVVGEVGKEPNYEKDINLYNELLIKGHLSPFEHCAKAMSWEEIEYNKSITHNEITLGISNNFVGWHQYRKLLQK